MSCAAVVALFVLCCLMKWVAATRMHGAAKERWAFIFSPLISPTSFARSRPLSDAPKLLGKTVFLLGGLVFIYWTWWRFLPEFPLSPATLGYLAVVPLMLLTNFLANVLALAWIPSGRLLPSFHQNPPAAVSINDFWGRRWNLWLSDWFRSIILKPLRRKPVVALFVIFILSGAIHELCINVPLYFITGRRLFGAMTIYYLLQALGILIERRVPRNALRLRLILLWLVVFLPVPLMMNEGMLRIMHLWV